MRFLIDSSFSKLLKSIIFSCMEKAEYSRIPINYSIAYHTMFLSKENPNYCVKEFLEYLEKVGNIIPSGIGSEIHQEVLRLPEEKQRKELIQAINLELTIEGVEDLFPGLLKSKDISRDQIEALLKKASSHKS